MATLKNGTYQYLIILLDLGLPIPCYLTGFPHYAIPIYLRGQEVNEKKNQFFILFFKFCIYANFKIEYISRDRHILKKDPKKWGTGDPLKLSNFFAKIVFLVLLYKTASKFLKKSTNFGYF